MPARKSDLKITIEANGKRFSLNCEKLLWNTYRVKVGRSRSVKMPMATPTQIFNEARKWAVKTMKINHQPF